MYENIHVLNVRVNKFSWVPHEDILTWNVFQLNIIEITVHVLLIMTSYFAIATSVLVLQRYLSAITLHTHSILSPLKIQSSVTRPLQRQCYPSIAIGDKNSHKSAQAWVPMHVNCWEWLCYIIIITMKAVSFCQTITTELGLCGFNWRQTAITQSLLEI